jgi:hypothetical protein
MFQKMGFGVYLFFASMMIVSIPIVWLIVPETSGIALESMTPLFELPPRKAHGIIMARAQTAQDDRAAAANQREGEDEKGIESREEYV